MTGILLLIPIAVGLGLLALLGFLWALHSNQFEDLDSAATRILYDEDPKKPDENRRGQEGR